MTHTFRIPLVGLCTLLLAGAAQAQTSGPATRQNPPASRMARKPMAGVLDAAFAKKVSRSNAAEIAVSKVVLERGSTQAVKDLAQMLITDHTNAQNNLRDIARTKDMALPEKPDAAQQAREKKLRAMSGVALEKQYVAGQIQAHAQAIALFQGQARSGKDPELRRFATETLPNLQAHARHVQQVAQQLGVPISKRQQMRMPDSGPAISPERQ